VPVSLEDRLVALIRDSFPAGVTIGVALSGGGDSTALLHLCRAAGFAVEALTVDHRLRPESAVEAATVGDVCRTLGIRHEVRVWDHGEVHGNLMGLIRDWAASRGIGTVALGHTRDDQAETVLMGLGRGAGLAGLSGMRPEWDEGGVWFYRPLLAAGREELRDWLRARGIGWIDDPTNEDERFTRVKARKALAALAPLGITAKRLAEVARNLAQAQASLELMVAAVCESLVEEQAGALRLAEGFLDQPAEVTRQVVLVCLAWLSGAGYAPRAEAVRQLLSAMDAGRDATLAGCRFRRGWLMREPRALGGAVPVGTLWDGRWRVTGPQGEVRALGADGLRQLPDWKKLGLPREVLLVTPAVWHGETLLSAPLAGRPADWQAKLDRPFHLFGIGD
jgi:tRNA(Ile)-lysidine synthase